MSANQNNEIKKLRRQLWIIALILLLSIGAYSIYNYYDCREEKSELRELIISLSDTLSNTRDSIQVLNVDLITNKLKEDSLQNIIDHTLGKLERLERKLQTMQTVNAMSTDIVINIVDSMELLRTQSVRLKHQIDSINRKNASLLQNERIQNADLRKKIVEYERRLMTIFAINIQIKIYKDGVDSNKKLETTNVAKKVEEIIVSFDLTRELNNNDEISIEFTKGPFVIQRLHKLSNISQKKVRKSFKFDVKNELTQGKYYIKIYHTNTEYGIDEIEVGRGFIELE